MRAAVADGTIVGMDARPLTPRERAVLDALLAIDLHDADSLRRQAADAVVAGTCGCGCPSIDFEHGLGRGMSVKVNASVRGSHDGLFLYTVEDPSLGEILGGIEWLSGSETDPDELPSPDLLDIQAA